MERAKSALSRAWTSVFQEQFRTTQGFMFGVFISIVLYHIHVLIQTTVILISIVFVGAGFVIQWSQVATKVRENMHELVWTIIWEQIKEWWLWAIGKFIPTGVKSCFNWVYNLFAPSPEKDVQQQISEWSNALIVGVTVGSSVHLIIQLILWLLDSRGMSAIFYVFAFFWEKSYLAITFYTIGVAILSTAVAVAYAILFPAVTPTEKAPES